MRGTELRPLLSGRMGEAFLFQTCLVRQEDTRPTPSNEQCRLDNDVCPLCPGVYVWRAHRKGLGTHQGWSGWVLPVPIEIGLLLVVITGAACLLTVVNLALKGLGAPFASALNEFRESNSADVINTPLNRIDCFRGLDRIPKRERFMTSHRAMTASGIPCGRQNDLYFVGFSPLAFPRKKT